MILSCISISFCSSLNHQSSTNSNPKTGGKICGVVVWQSLCDHCQDVKGNYLDLAFSFSLPVELDIHLLLPQLSSSKPPHSVSLTANCSGSTEQCFQLLSTDFSGWMIWAMLVMCIWSIPECAYHSPKSSCLMLMCSSAVCAVLCPIGVHTLLKHWKKWSLLLIAAALEKMKPYINSLLSVFAEKIGKLCDRC
jgi:hypothetical protein